MRRLLLVIILCAILTALNGCASPIPVRSTATAAPVNCMYNWSSRESDPALVRRVQEALVAAGLTGASAQIGEYGEVKYCTDGSSNFLLKEYTLRVTLPVVDLADRQALGSQLGQALPVLERFATASQNRFAVSFTAGGAEENLLTTKEAWTKARGLTGAALLDALQTGR